MRTKDVFGLCRPKVTFFYPHTAAVPSHALHAAARAVENLYIFLHECAHAHLGHAHNGKTPRHVEEMEAEKWER